MPRKTRGRRSCKIAVTESVTEKTPPVLWQQSAGKGEKARQELTARGAIREARKTPCGARQNRGRAAGPSILGYRRITLRTSAAGIRRNPGEINDHYGASNHADRIRLTAIKI